MGQPDNEAPYHVFLSHSHADTAWVEELAKRLEDEQDLKPWLDRWDLIPGKPWQREMARGLEQARSCAVCLSGKTPRGWFEKEVEKAQNRQAKDPEFAVIPVILPDADEDVAASLGDTFLDLNTWVDFREGSDPAFALYLLTCGIKGLPPGRWEPAQRDRGRDQLVEKLRRLKTLRDHGLVDDAVARDKQSRLVDIYLEL